MWPSGNYTTGSLAEHKRLCMKESNILADNVTISSLQRVFLLSIKWLCMKESFTLADNVAIKHHQRAILLSIKGLCMKESNTLVNIVFISQLQRVLLLATKKLCMKELISYCRFQTRQISNVTRKLCHTLKFFFYKLNCV